MYIYLWRDEKHYLYFFRLKNNPIWGYMTIALTFVPAILGFLMARGLKKRFLAFIKHLPGIQIYTHLKCQWDIVKGKNKVKQLDRQVMVAKNNNELEKSIKLQTERDASEKGVQNDERKLNEFKAKEAFGESYPQTLLQLTILLKEGISYNFKAISAIVTSILSLQITLSGLLVSLPFYMFNVKQTPFKSLSLQFIIVLPIVTMAMSPRLTTVILYFSQFDKTNAWLCVTILAILGLLYFVGYWCILRFSVRPKMVKGNQCTQHSHHSR